MSLKNRKCLEFGWAELCGTVAGSYLNSLLGRFKNISKTLIIYHSYIDKTSAFAI